MSNSKVLKELAQDMDGKVGGAALHAEHAGCAFELRRALPLRVVSGPGRFGFDWIVSHQLMAD